MPAIMNRRHLFAMLPAAPFAMSLAAIAQAAEASVPSDTRPTFRLGDYVVWEPHRAYLCDVHGVDHHAYTHGCQPVAFPKDHTLFPGAMAHPATPDAIPTDVYQGCPFSTDMCGPHEHHDFRWVDA